MNSKIGPQLEMGNLREALAILRRESRLNGAKDYIKDALLLGKVCEEENDEGLKDEILTFVITLLLQCNDPKHLGEVSAMLSMMPCASVDALKFRTRVRQQVSIIEQHLEQSQVE